MKVNNNIVENNFNNKVTKQNIKNETEPTTNELSFKGIDSLLGGAGYLMNSIENGGFVTSFLIQDALGMTAPRVGAGFLRDKEVTGKYNKQEGFEVLLREGLTGPMMMAVAPTALLIASLCGKTTSVNTRLIKRLGENLKTLISDSNLDKTLLKNKDKFKDEFFKLNVKQMLENTLGKENVTDNAIKHIVDKLKEYNNIPSGTKKGKHHSKILNDITKYINDIKFNTSDELNMLNKVKFGTKDNIKEFSTKDTIDAILKFADEAIDSNKNFEKLTTEAAENIKDAAVSKRILTTGATVASTLGVMSVIPKIYARNEIAPGARTAMELKAKKQEESSDISNNPEVSFKGRGDKGILSKLGKILNRFSKEKFAGELEYNGHNFTPTLMTGLSLFGLLAPRGKRAYDRAQVDKNGKKDLTELWEILIRDVSSSLAVVFAVPMLTRAAVSSYEGNSGFVLMHKDRSKTGFNKFIDIINPYSSAHVLTNSEIEALYNNINNKEKMVNFCKFIENNNGDLEKILKHSAELDNLIKEGKLELPNLANLDKKAKNIKLRTFFEELGKDNKLSKETVDEIITKLMKGTGKAKNNKILSFARGLNSVPGLIATFLISPFILGWLIPRATYANTRRIHEKKAQEQEAKMKATA